MPTGIDVYRLIARSPAAQRLMVPKVRRSISPLPDQMVKTPTADLIATALNDPDADYSDEERQVLSGLQATR